MPKGCAVIATPFGYGPAVTADLVAQELICHGWECDFIGSAELLALVSSPYRKKISVVDDRDPAVLRTVLKGYDCILSVMNKVAVAVGNERGLYTVYFDTLPWLHSSIPADHRIADCILWPKMAGVEKKITSRIKDKVVLLPGILRAQEERRTSDWDTLIDLGGVANPHQDGFERYARILAEAVNGLPDRRILITVGKRHQGVVRNLVGNQNVSVRFTPYQEHFRLMQSAKSYLNCGGRLGIMDALSIGLPIALLFPTNLSQVVMGSLLRQYGIPCLSWDSLGFDEAALHGVSEERAIASINRWAGIVIRQPALLEQASRQIRQLLAGPAKTSPIKKLTEDLGMGGAAVAAERISSRALPS